MTHPLLDRVSRSERRRLLVREARARKSGFWGRWELVSNDEARDKFRSLVGRDPRGWLREVTRCHRCVPFAVLERPVQGATHLAVTCLSGERPSWREMQRIKNDLAGSDRQAVEIYPPEDQIVDEADMYHIWVLDEPLPLTLQWSPV